jgi:hypothetical protein
MRTATVFTSLLVAAGVSYCGYMQYEDHVRQAAERERSQIEGAEVIRSLEAMADRHGAHISWASALAGSKGHRTSPVMSAELQQLWLASKPILFVGALRDIARQDDGNYEVLLEYPEFGFKQSFSDTGIHLRVVCTPEQTAPLLALAKSRRRPSVFADVALVAKVSSVSSQLGRSGESEPELRLTVIVRPTPSLRRRLPLASI